MGLTKQDADYGYDGDNDYRDDDDAARPKRKRKRRDWLSHLPDNDSDIDNGDGEVCCYSICLAFLWINSLFLFVIFTPVSLFQS